MDPNTALITHKNNVLDYTSTQELHVNRHSETIVRHLFKKLNRKDIEIKRIPDVTFIGEDGIDAEGLTKELFSIVMNSLKCGTGGYVLFEGSDDHLLPIINEEYHQSGYFKYVGQLIGMSVLHAGFGMAGMSRALSVLLATDDVDKAMCHLSISDVPDYGIQEILHELQGLDDPASLTSFSTCDDISMLLYHAGFTNEALTPQTKEKAIQCVLLHQVFRSRTEQIDDIKHGLQEGLILNLLRSNPSCVRIVFPLNSEHVLKATEILQLIRSDSDLTEKQAQVLAWFREYVQKIEDGDNDNEIDGGLRSLPKLEHLLQFTCDSPYIPSNGKKIDVQFTMGDLPDPDACFGILKLPMNYLTLNEFMKNMNIAINCQHKGFGRA